MQQLVNYYLDYRTSETPRLKVKKRNQGELLLGLPYLRNQLFGFGGEKAVNYCLIYGTSETRPWRASGPSSVNYCLIYGTSETTPASRVRMSSVSYYLVYGTFETERQRVAHRRMVNYYLDYRTSETNGTPRAYL